MIKNYLVDSKNSNKDYIKLWQQLVTLKSKLSAKENRIKQMESSETRRPLNGSRTDLELNDNNISQLNVQIKALYNQIDNMVFNEFIKESNKNSYSHLLKIVWQLKNNIILSEIFRGLAEMSNKGSSIESLFFYHYAKRQVSRTLKSYYYQRDVYFRKEGPAKKEIFKIEQELNTINKVGVDIAYAFWYKRKLEKLVGLII